MDMEGKWLDNSRLRWVPGMEQSLRHKLSHRGDSGAMALKWFETHQVLVPAEQATGIE